MLFCYFQILLNAILLFTVVHHHFLLECFLHNLFHAALVNALLRARIYVTRVSSQFCSK